MRLNTSEYCILLRENKCGTAKPPEKKYILAAEWLNFRENSCVKVLQIRQETNRLSSSSLQKPGIIYLFNHLFACLLGVPLGCLESISAVLRGKMSYLKLMGERLEHISAHDALILLCNSFAIPKLLYTLRTAPCFLSPVLGSYDDLLQSIVSRITNITFTEDVATWSQATLPIRMGGLGIRRSVQLAPSAFLASAAATSDLVHHILPAHLQSLTTPKHAHFGLKAMRMPLVRLVSRELGIFTLCSVSPQQCS